VAAVVAVVHTDSRQREAVIMAQAALAVVQLVHLLAQMPQPTLAAVVAVEMLPMVTKAQVVQVLLLFDTQILLI
jgi:hypothetical protein